MPDVLRLAAVEISGLSFSYGDGMQALNGVDLRVAQGERLALLGRNGAGKSTLLLHLNGLLRGEGDVVILGQPARGEHLRLIRQQVGLVFHNPDDQLFMPSVYDEVAYAAVNAGLTRASVDLRVAQVLATCGLSGLERRHPSRLSLGQKKRLAIASVLATDNRILVLDEPSASLDPPGRDDLLALLRSLPATLIVATHDLDFAAALCESAALLEAGRVIGRGPFAEVAAAFASHCKSR